jgi:putative glutamine amidotransferase
MKKKLGITDTNKVQRYIDWFSSTDLADDVEIVTLTKGSNDHKSCSGILLTGGIDVHPDLYDGSTDYPNADEHDLERDEYETKVYEYAKINKHPILAICRGLQLVNVIEGGTLIQDLGEGNEAHKKEGADDKLHVVDIDSRTMLGDITGVMSGTVNSAHHQAADPEAIGRELVTNAFSRDGVVEGLEFKNKTNKGFMIAVQWHPERMTDKDENPLSKSVKKAFLAAIRS